MDKIEEVKKLLWILDSKHNVSIPQTKENIDFIADEIVKLFAIPVVRRSFFTYINGKRTLVNQNINSGDIIWVLDPLTERWYVEECIEVIGDEFIKHTNNNETVTEEDMIDSKEIGCISSLVYCYKES